MTANEFPRVRGPLEVLLVQPAPLTHQGQVIRQRKLWVPGLTLPLLSALTPGHVRLTVVYETIDALPLDGDFDLVAVSAMGSGLIRGIEIARHFRGRGIPVVAGGPMVSLAQGLVAGNFDSIAIGEAEILWPKILADLAKGCLGPRYQTEELCNLDELPVPDYGMLRARRFGAFAPVQVGRGCIHACEFCSIHKLNRGTYRRRRIANVLRDLDQAAACGKTRALIIDDNIASDPAYAGELFTALARRDLEWVGQCNIADLAAHPELIAQAARSGCRILNFGLETLHQANLERVNKSFQSAAAYGPLIREIKAAGISISAEMILGLDHDTVEAFGDMAAFCLEQRLESPKFYILTPIPGTDWWARVRREGRLLTEDWSRYNASHAVFLPAGLSPDALERAYWKLYETVYSAGAIFRRMTRGPRRGPFFEAFLWAGNFYYRSLIRRRIAPGVV